MLAGLTSRQVTEWAAYYRIEHLGDAPDFRADLRAGIVAAAATAPHTRKRVTPEDFLPQFERRYEDPESIRQALVGMDPSRRVPRRSRQTAAGSRQHETAPLPAGSESDRGDADPTQARGGDGA